MKVTIGVVLALIFVGTIRLAQWICALIVILFAGVAGYELVMRARGWKRERRAA
jgi:hypothetical protein